MGGQRKVEVHRDNRTLAEKRADNLKNLSARRGQLGMPVCWLGEIDDLIEASRRRMEKDIRRMHDRMFHLLPLSGDGVDPWGVPICFPPALSGCASAMMQAVEKEMRELEGEMEAGVRGSEGAGDARQGLDLFPTHDCLTGGGAMDGLKDNYQIGEDGQLHLSVNFNTKEFAPEDIHVTASDNRLVVQAKKTVETETSKSMKQFYRRIDLPESVESKAMQCRLSQDGVLSVDVPVRQVDYKSVTFDEGRRLAIKPTSAGSGELQVTGKEGVTVVTDAEGRRRVHLEVRLQPGFTSDNVSVRVEKKEVIVSGKQVVKQTETGGGKKEFSETYQVPETLDPMAIRACVRDGVLVVEAALVSNATSTSS